MFLKREKSNVKFIFSVSYCVDELVLIQPKAPKTYILKIGSHIKETAQGINTSCSPQCITNTKLYPWISTNNNYLKLKSIGRRNELEGKDLKAGNYDITGVKRNWYTYVYQNLYKYVPTALQME